MKHLKRYFSRENDFSAKRKLSLKECFNMMVVLMTCFFTKVLCGVSRFYRAYVEDHVEEIPEGFLAEKMYLAKFFCGTSVLVGIRKKGEKRIRDVLYEKGLQRIRLNICRGSPVLQTSFSD